MSAIAHGPQDDIARAQGFDVTTRNFFEALRGDPGQDEVWAYTDRVSYRPGESVHIHAWCAQGDFSAEIIRDGAAPRRVHAIEGLTAEAVPLRPDFYAEGCGWARAASWRLPDDLEGGFHILRVRSGQAEHEHGFFVRPAAGAARKGRILLVAATSTWAAYNDWGGANSYALAKAHGGALPFAPRLSLHRPLARGFVSLPVGAPRKPHDRPPAQGAVPRHPPIEFAFARGYSKWYANAGWASYERPFVVWAEACGYALDYAAQSDLHAEPDLLNGYDGVVIVGHDEYWSWEMREAVEAYVEDGGRLARFGGNFIWQVRLETGAGSPGAVQVCYKDTAKTHDPLGPGLDPRRLTGLWDEPAVGWPGAQTLGLSGLYGVYAQVGAQSPRAGGGFTVYRPEHWAFAGSDLYYGDVFGGDANILGYEVDGLDYVVRDGLPYPTFRDGAPQSVEILAMGLANNREVMRGRRGEAAYYGDTSPFLAKLRYGSDDETSRDAAARGSAMIVHFTRGAGEVFNAGSCEWVNGLAMGDPFTQTITRNVLDRLLTR